MKINIITFCLIQLFLFNCTFAEDINCKKYVNEDKFSLDAFVKLEFYFNTGELNAKIEAINCSKDKYYFYPNSLGRDSFDSFMIFYVQKVDMLEFKILNQPFMDFIPPEEPTPYMNKNRDDLRKRIALHPQEVSIGNSNLSKRFDITSGFYLISFVTTSFDYKAKVKPLTRKPEDQLWTLSSKKYLIDIDVENQKVLYSKALH
jgi:hypothetical protein